MNTTEQLALLGILGVAGVAVLSLTRKSEAPETPAPPPPPVEVPVARPLVKMPELDAGLSNMERFAVQKAVSTETLPANLTGFASSFEPMFPIAAAVLRAQATSLKVPGPSTGKAEPCCQECEDHPDQPPCTPKVTGPAITAGLPSLFGVDIA